MRTVSVLTVVYGVSIILHGEIGNLIDKSTFGKCGYTVHYY